LQNHAKIVEVSALAKIARFAIFVGYFV
jgi:hypothetical protein